MTAPDLDQELLRQTTALNIARSSARDGRPGIRDPISVLIELARSQQAASKFFGDHASELPNADQLLMFEFTREVVLAATQYLSYARQIPLLPHPGTEELMDDQGSQNFRLGQLKVAMAAFKSVVIDAVPIALVLELKGAILQAAGLAMPELEEAWCFVAETLLDECNAAAAANAPDPNRLIPFVKVQALLALADASDNSARAAHNLLEIEPASLDDPDAAWNLTIGQVVWAADSSPEHLALALGRLTEAVNWSLALPAEQRLSRRATAEDQIIHAAATLASDGDLSGATDLLDELGRLCGYAPAEPGTVHFFAALRSVHAIVRLDGGQSEYVSTPVAEDRFRQIILAGADGSEDNALRAIRAAVKPLTREPTMRRCNSLVIDPLGLVAWWPWHTASTGEGTLSETHEISWRRGVGTSVPEGAVRGSLLVIDISFQESTSILAAWKRSVDGHVITFSSDDDDNGSIKSQILDALSAHSDVTYFGHAHSDPLAYAASGLQLGGELLISLAELAEINLPPERVTLIACGSGRSNLKLGGLSPAHSLAAAGVREIIATLWPIDARDGRKYLQKLFECLGHDPDDLGAAWRQLSRTREDWAPFMYMGPASSDAR